MKRNCLSTLAFVGMMVLGLGVGISHAQTNWTKYPGNPVLDLGANGTWDDFLVINPMVILDGVDYKMWYAGNDGTNWRIGYATSSDGITWTKHASNPVLDLGAS